MATIGLRYFNVFGARQDPEGAYAAVIPRWVDAMLRGAPVVIHGDGETTRDFCYVANVVEANLLAATTADAAAINQVYNVAVGGRMSLNELYATLRTLLGDRHSGRTFVPPVHEDFRAGDVRHSQADISKAKRHLGYDPALRRARRTCRGVALVRGAIRSAGHPAIAGERECSQPGLTAGQARLTRGALFCVAVAGWAFAVAANRGRDQQRA